MAQQRGTFANARARSTELAMVRVTWRANSIWLCNRPQSKISSSYQGSVTCLCQENGWNRQFDRNLVDGQRILLLLVDLTGFIRFGLLLNWAKNDCRTWSSGSRTNTSKMHTLFSLMNGMHAPQRLSINPASTSKITRLPGPQMFDTGHNARMTSAHWNATVAGLPSVVIASRFFSSRFGNFSPPADMWLEPRLDPSDSTTTTHGAAPTGATGSAVSESFTHSILVHLNPFGTQWMWQSGSHDGNVSMLLPRPLSFPPSVGTRILDCFIFRNGACGMPYHLPPWGIRGFLGGGSVFEGGVGVGMLLRSRVSGGHTSEEGAQRERPHTADGASVGGLATSRHDRCENGGGGCGCGCEGVEAGRDGRGGRGKGRSKKWKVGGWQ